ncbi:arginase family protein [soil metagenome]
MHGRLRRSVRPVLLHLDDALLAQSTLAARVAASGGQALDMRDIGPAIRLWSRPGPLQILEDRVARAVPADERPLLAFNGSGDFHHVTPLLIRRACASAGHPPLTIVHFDNHPDWVTFEPGLHCGSWVGAASRIPGVEKVITVGVCSADIDTPANAAAETELIESGRLEMYAYRAPRGGALDLFGRRWPTIQSLGEAAFSALLDQRIETQAVYVTIDKDVLRSRDAATNWDQGEIGLDYLKTLIGVAGTGRRLIGADVTGDWSKPRYGGPGLDGWMKRGEAMLDQPWSPPSPGARRLNEAVNVALFDCLDRVVR